MESSFDDLHGPHKENNCLVLKQRPEPGSQKKRDLRIIADRRSIFLVDSEALMNVVDLTNGFALPASAKPVFSS